MGTESTCRVPNCTKPARTRGLCHAHYFHFKRPGSREHAAAVAAALPSKRPGRAPGGPKAARAIPGRGRKTAPKPPDALDAARRRVDRAKADRHAIMAGAGDDAEPADLPEIAAPLTDLAAALGLLRIRVPTGLALIRLATARVVVLTDVGALRRGTVSVPASNADPDAGPNPDAVAAVRDAAAALGLRTADTGPPEDGGIVLIACEETGKVAAVRPDGTVAAVELDLQPAS